MLAKGKGKSNFLDIQLNKDRLDGAKAIIIDLDGIYSNKYFNIGDKILEYPKFELNIFRFKKDILNWIYKNNDSSWLFIKCDVNESKLIFKLIEDDMNEFNNKYRSKELRFYSI